MKAEQLELRELLDLHEEGGVLRFAGQRTLLLDAAALGLLRRELIETIGVTAARGVLTRFGYAHGWRTAEGLKDEALEANGGNQARTAAQLGIGTATPYR